MTGEDNNNSTQAQPQEGDAKSGKKKGILKEIFEWVYSLAIAVAVAMLIKGFLFDMVKVEGSSMYPTLVDGDRLIVTKLGYEPKQGDIVILDSTYRAREEYFKQLAAEEGKEDLSDFTKFIKGFGLPDELKKVYYVKRVIATEGQTVDIKDGKVYVDGEQLDEPYYSGETYSIDPDVQFPVTVDEDCIFVMGDNRGHSLDSRSSKLGQVEDEAVLGHSQIRVFPFNSISVTK